MDIKNSIISVLAVLGAGTLFTVSCQKVEESAQQEPVYQLSIPACFDGAVTKAVDFDANGSDISATFKTTDKIYVYNQTQQAWASNGWDGYMTLSPAEDGRKTQLAGALKFYWMDARTDNGTIITSKPVTPEVGDVLHLFCNPRAVISEPLRVGFYYSNTQTGSAASASAHDYVKATMKIKSIDGDDTDGYTLTLCQVDDETETTAMFQNVGSMYRQHLTFKNAANETVTPDITGIRIDSKKSKLRHLHWPLGEFLNYTVDPNYGVVIDHPEIGADGDLYVALRFVDSDDTDALMLTVTDSENNVYECTKAAPSGGFQNGNYYSGEMTLTWARQLILPTITGATAMGEPDANGLVAFDDDPADITFSGTSSGYFFMVWNYGKVTFDNLAATYMGTDSAFLNQNKSSKDNELVLTGTNTLNCATCVTAVDFNGNLKLKCTGDSATLSITTARADFCGLKAKNYNRDSNNRATTSEIDLTSQLAADRYTVTRSARVDNGDGSYTWTYTVEPIGI